MKKYKRTIKLETLKLLLARSGNQCAFPDCTHPLFDDNNVFIAQLCHIEAVSPNGQRFNSSKCESEINSYDNLLFLCYRHHKVTDDTKLFPVNKLIELKKNHEAKFTESNFKYSNQVITNLELDIKNFWLNIEYLNKNHVVPELSFNIDTHNSPLSLISELNLLITNLSALNDYLIREIKKTHFESVCIEMPNLLTKMSLCIDQLEIKILEQSVLNEPGNIELLEKLKGAREKLAEIASYIGLAD